MSTGHFHMKARALMRASEAAFHLVYSWSDAIDDSIQLSAVSEDPKINGLLIVIRRNGEVDFAFPAAPRFPDYDAAAAQAEGWGMFETEGRYQLQRDDEADVFESDGAAIIHVALRASMGDKMHCEAINMIGQLVDPT